MLRIAAEFEALNRTPKTDGIPQELSAMVPKLEQGVPIVFYADPLMRGDQLDRKSVV